MNTAQEKEDFPQAKLRSASASYIGCDLYMLFLKICSSPPTCFSGANLLRAPITSHRDTESTWSHCPPSLSVGMSEALFSSSESDLINSTLRSAAI